MVEHYGTIQVVACGFVFLLLAGNVGDCCLIVTIVLLRTTGSGFEDGREGRGGFLVLLLCLIVVFIDVCMVTPNPGGIVAAVAAGEAPPDNQSCFARSSLLLFVVIYRPHRHRMCH